MLAQNWEFFRHNWNIILLWYENDNVHDMSCTTDERGYLESDDYNGHRDDYNWELFWVMTYRGVVIC